MMHCVELGWTHDKVVEVVVLFSVGTCSVFWKRNDDRLCGRQEGLLFACMHRVELEVCFTMHASMRPGLE